MQVDQIYTMIIHTIAYQYSEINMASKHGSHNLPNLFNTLSTKCLSTFNSPLICTVLLEYYCPLTFTLWPGLDVMGDVL